MPFDVKAWLDANVIPVLGEGDERLRFYSVLWNGDPPKEILTFVLAGAETDGKLIGNDSWGLHVKRLLEAGWRFDFLREQAVVKMEGGLVPIFGGDGAPIFGKNGMASVRLFKKMDDGIASILQVGAQFKDGIDAAAAVKGFFGLFGEDAIKICHTYGAVFGAA